jgi:membrane protease subunit (stomatin/prohibitin family)
MRAAIVGGAGVAAGRHMANTRQAEDEQNAQIAQLQAQQAAPVAPAPAAGGGDMVAQLESLKKLLDEGILTQAEFDMQKQKLLAGA